MKSDNVAVSAEHENTKPVPDNQRFKCLLGNCLTWNFTKRAAQEKAEAKRLAKGKAAAKADIQEVIDATSLHIQLRYTLLPVNLPQDNHPEDPEAPFDPQNIPGREIIADTGGYYIHQRFAKDEDTLKQYHNGNSWISSSEIPTTWSSITSAHATPPQPAAALP
ncbi:hypothetical protein EG328_002979 [Venturia inaequalis]|uniref:Uncharacterized protein n=1 Tax=Venturia inaequalis TaxID=5025 RepID=A0A8H3UT17_VENIN|nr:hypothetical protein EG328_002979 [Venturia inaequalis]